MKVVGIRVEGGGFNLLMDNGRKIFMSNPGRRPLRIMWPLLGANTGEYKDLYKNGQRVVSVYDNDTGILLGGWWRCVDGIQDISELEGVVK